MQMMKRLSMARYAYATVAGTLVLSACAQNSDSTVPPAAATTTTPAAVASPNVVNDLAKDVAGIEQKFVDLAKAMPDAAYTYRPMAGVRSTQEVFLHMASENYLLPAMFGAAIPAETKIVAGDFKTAGDYEKQAIKKDSVVAEVQASFAHIRKAMAADSGAIMSGEIDFFGTKMSRQAAWIGTVTHMHEHLGQLIAYARSNKVVPPWSK
ncbi:MAG: DinB family protein [Gemmatimonadaceae bacterium]